jgi:hypothetical protein
MKVTFHTIKTIIMSLINGLYIFTMDLHSVKLLLKVYFSQKYHYEYIHRFLSLSFRKANFQI